ncbi:MAG: triose-phosphate isomerase family protein, partial [Thermodesulfobacteriota bacterium]
MAKKLVAANWKMNLLRSEARALVNSIHDYIGKDYSGVDVVLAPSFTLLETVGVLLEESNIELGAQNIFWENSGAYTGEISPLMVKDLRCSWVIIGHSERRKIIGETDEIVSKKVKIALDSGLKIILCVGETLEQREKGIESEIIQNQVEIALKNVNNDM